MGTQRQLSRMEGNQRRATTAYKLSRDLQTFYGTHFVSEWQRDYVAAIRKTYEQKLHALEASHYQGSLQIAKDFFGEEYDKKIKDHNTILDYSASQLSEKYMQLELDYLMASEEYKKKNPGKKWHPGGVRGLFSSAFWHNLFARADQLGVKWDKNHGQAKAAN